MAIYGAGRKGKPMPYRGHASDKQSMMEYREVRGELDYGNDSLSGWLKSLFRKVK